jgi:DNA-binding beta-propeller fold protein YncE
MSAQEGPSPAEAERGDESMTVEIDGTSRRLPAEHDYTGDGRPDAAVETPDGTVIVFADTEDNETGAPGPDGRADEAYVIDKRTGQVVSAAHVDPASGAWVDADGRPVGVSTGGRPGSMTVPTADGVQELPAEHDYTGDGRPDAAVETPDGRVVVFADTEDNETGAPEPDGRADEAWIVDKSTGRAVGEAHVDSASGGWVEDSGPGGGSR